MMPDVLQFIFACDNSDNLNLNLDFVEINLDFVGYPIQIGDRLQFGPFNNNIFSTASRQPEEIFFMFN